MTEPEVLTKKFYELREYYKENMDYIYKQVLNGNYTYQKANSGKDYFIGYCIEQLEKLKEKL